MKQETMIKMAAAAVLAAMFAGCAENADDADNRVTLTRRCTNAESGQVVQFQMLARERLERGSTRWISDEVSGQGMEFTYGPEQRCGIQSPEHSPS